MLDFFKLDLAVFTEVHENNGDEQHMEICISVP
jgi:hypothetical protein